jgi:long-chain acyl-CoA synthetase
MTLAKCKCVVADGKLAKVLAKIAPKLQMLEHVVILDAASNKAEVEALRAAGVAVTSVEDLEAMGREAPVEPTPPAPSDTAVLMYTSGTTGNPKGVLIPHSALVAVAAASIEPAAALGGIISGPGVVYLAYHPLAHKKELVCELMMLMQGCALGYGGTGTLLPTSPKMLQTKPPQKGDAQALRPHLFLAAPAVLDKILVAVKGKIGAKGKLVQKLFKCAFDSGDARFDAGKVGAGGCLGLLMKPIQKLLGGRLRIFCTGSAPLAVGTQKFVQTVFSCPVRQGYGLTETCAATCVQLLADQAPSVVGPPQEASCIRRTAHRAASVRLRTLGAAH